jgi:hypothetical protein
VKLLFRQVTVGDFKIQYEMLLTARNRSLERRC